MNEKRGDMRVRDDVRRRRCSWLIGLTLGASVLGWGAGAAAADEFEIKAEPLDERCPSTMTDPKCVDTLDGVVKNIDDTSKNVNGVVDKRLAAIQDVSKRAAATKAVDDLKMHNDELRRLLDAYNKEGDAAVKRKKHVPLLTQYNQLVEAYTTAVAAFKNAEASAAAPDPAVPLAQIEKACKTSCKAPDAFCINAQDGEPLCKDLSPDVYGLPDSIDAGGRITVRVFGMSNLKPKIELKVLFNRSLEVLFGGSIEVAHPKDASPQAAPQFEELATEVSEVSAETTIDAVKIQFRRSDEDPKKAVSETYVIPISHGEYYLEFGALFPIVILGSRKVEQINLPGSGGQRRLTIAEDSSVNPAIVLNVFPGGRRRGNISSCRHHCEVGDFFGFQAGVDLDLGKPFDRIFLGGVFEPISGLSLNGGIAIVQQEYLPSGHVANMILSASESFSPAHMYTPRFYFGATLTLDIINAASTATRSVTNALTR